MKNSRRMNKFTARRRKNHNNRKHLKNSIYTYRYAKPAVDHKHKNSTKSHCQMQKSFSCPNDKRKKEKVTMVTVDKTLFKQ